MSEEPKMIKKQIIATEENWKKIMEWAAAQNVPIFFMEDNGIHAIANMYLGHVKDILNSEGGQMLIGIADEFIKDKRAEKNRKELEDEDQEPI